MQRSTIASSLCALALLSSAVLARGEHPFETDAERKPLLVTHGSCVVRNVTIHSAVGPATVGDVLIEGGKIRAIGEVEVGPDVLVLDGTGKHLAPGVVDNHSHIAIDSGVNEGTLSITADCDISDSLDPDDLSIYRALAGGVTTARLLHGSANAIGGRHEVIKLKWRVPYAELVMRGAPEGVKFALGENPKRSNSAPGSRFPDTRMGVEVVFERAFARAAEYSAEWKNYRDAKARGEDLAPPRRDVRLDALAGILDGTIDVHSHCYRADEILMLLRVAERFGFKVKTLQHVLEGYKVAKEIAAHGAGPSTFGDWWAYKIEAYDAVPQNAALMDQAGCVTSLNSDSAEMMRRLYGEAAKSVRYAGLDDVRALALVTINSARQLGIEARTGSIEVGKDADLVLLDGEPLSSLAKPLWTMVDGEIQFQRRDAFELETKPVSMSALSEPDRSAGVAWNPNGGETIALVGGRLHPVTSSDIESGALVLQDGLIVALGANVSIPAGATVIDVTGQDVWPGVIALGTPLGLFEIGSVAGTDDVSEIGGDQPDLRASASLAADSAHIPVTRTNGITRAQTGPSGGGPLRGQSCVIRLAGDTWEELLVKDRDMLHVDFPRVANDAKEKAKKGDALKALEKKFVEAREYARLVDEARIQGVAAPAFDPRKAALAPYANAERRVAVHAQNAQTILAAVRFVREQKLDAVLYGCREAWKVVDVLAAEKIPVVVGPVLDLPTDEFSPYDAPYANAAVLARAGVPFAIESDDAENPRNVAFHAAMASAYGLPHAEAVRAITIYAAQILRMEHEVGSLAVGKVADVIVTRGDLLEIRSPVTYSFIGGVRQDLSNRQTQLYERWKKRLSRH
ncbi:MAG: amidohydrolase family protein [Planctomycetes bacterium]|nr:amidohydrolase family protein [Planctomycetota bacterium]